MSLSEALPRPQQLILCRRLHAEAQQATASEGLPQGPYVAATAGIEPTTLWSKGINSTNAPPRPTCNGSSCTMYCDNTGQFEIRVGIHQESCISPLLFIIVKDA